MTEPRRHECSRMRGHRAWHFKPETTEEWRARAIAAYERRHDPPPPPATGWMKALEELYALNYDVLHDPEENAFSAWMHARDDRLLWRTWSRHQFKPTESLTYGAERALPEGTRFVAPSWTERRALIEVFDLFEAR